MLVLIRGALSGKGHGAAAAAAAAAGASLLGWSSTRGYLTVIPKTRHPASHVRVVDLRTDSVTKPGPAMLQAMVEAAGRPELIGENPIVNELQKITADMFGMEDALFLPSGTMGNLVAVMSHCWGRGNEMIVGDLSHMHIYEQGSSAQVAGVHSTTVTTLRNGTFDLGELESRIRHNHPTLARSRLICLENTHNIHGGRVLPLTFLQEVRALADRYGLSVHMDGARLLNAAVAQGVPPHTILQHTHSVTMCLNKGLGAPVGSVLAGSKDFINRAVRAKYALGGQMGQISVLVAAGRVSLLDMVGRLEEDHHNAKTFAQALLDCDPPLFAVDMASVETNIVVFRLREPRLSPSEFCTRMVQVGEGEEAALGQMVQVAMIPFFGNSVRAVWHLGISPEDTQLAIQKMQYVVSQYSKDKRLCSASV